VATGLGKHRLHRQRAAEEVGVPDLLALERQEDQMAEFIGNSQRGDARWVAESRCGQPTERGQYRLAVGEMRGPKRDDDILAGIGGAHGSRNDPDNLGSTGNITALRGNHAPRRPPVLQGTSGPTETPRHQSNPARRQDWVG
jgi:hypothetical protein